LTPDRRPDLRKLERELHSAAERVRGEAQAAAERVKDEAQAAGERVRTEAPRKAIHLAMIVIPIGILHLPLTVSRRALMGAALVLLIADLAKIHQPRVRTYFLTFVGHLIRRHEREGITGSTYMIVSALLCTYLYQPGTAAAAMVFLIVGDTLAAMVGKAWGRTPLFGKTLEGFLAGLATSFAAAWLLVPGISPWHLLAAATAAAVVEIAPIPVDDNFRIPLLSGLVLEWLRGWI
jgi:dolichol kinase